MNEIILFQDQFLNDAFKGGGLIVPPPGNDFDTAGGRQMMQVTKISTKTNYYELRVLA